MDVVITARHFKPSPKLRDYVDEKFSRLARFCRPGVEELHVTLTAEKRLHRVEAVLGEIRIKQESQDIMAAIEKAADRLGEKLRKDHEKRREHKGRLGLKGSADGRASTRRVAASSPRVKREAHLAAEIDVDAAALKLTRSKKEFLVFVSRETGRVNVLYRRKDGQLGLIEPDVSDGTGRN